MERTMEKHADYLADVGARLAGHEQRATGFDEKLDAVLSVAERTYADLTSLRGVHDQRMAVVAERDRNRAERDVRLARWKVAALSLAVGLCLAIASRVLGW